MARNTLIERMNANLKRHFSDYRGVYFFGSRQRGDAREDSDYDLAFVFETKPDWRKEDRIRDIVYRYEVEHDVVIDGKYYAQDEIEHSQTPFRERVYTEGEFYGV
jgi:predicted nucleotidyltransferase